FVSHDPPRHVCLARRRQRLRLRHRAAEAKAGADMSHVMLKKRPDVHIAAVVPAYNVARELGAVLRSMPPMIATVVVVNDGSSDQTGAIADRYAELDRRIIVVHHPRNRGVGGAMVTGFRTAVDAGADILVKIDGDGQ